MSDRMDVFRQNERDANRYTAVCTLAAAGVALLMWLLNSLDFFIVDKSMMNLTMPIGTALFALPFVMVKCGANSGSWLKYLIMLCFLAGIAIPVPSSCPATTIPPALRGSLWPPP